MADEITPAPLDGPVSIVVHWLERSRAQRLVWLLEECKVSYQIKPYKRFHGHAPPEMTHVHPLGKSPMLTIQSPGQSEPLAFAESGAIFEYLVDYFAPHLRPNRFGHGQHGKICSETAGWLRYRYYMHYGEGSFMSLLMRVHDVHGIEGAEHSSVAVLLKRNVETHLTCLESQIQSSPDSGSYICGKDLTAADILISFPLLVVLSSMGGLTEYPGLTSYVERLTSREPYKEAVKKAERVTGETYRLV